MLAEKEMPVKKKHIEVLGSYNPRKKLFQVNEERVKYWISTRVELSPTVHNLFVTRGLLQAPKVKAFSTPKKKEEPAAAPAAPAATPAAEPVATETPASEEKKESAPAPEPPGPEPAPAAEEKAPESAV